MAGGGAAKKEDAKADVPSGAYKLLSGAEYKDALGLDSDGEEEADDEIEAVREAWKAVQEDSEAKGRSAERGRLLKRLGLQESEEVLEQISGLSEWTLESFGDWYVRFMLVPDEDEDSDYDVEAEVEVEADLAIFQNHIRINELTN